MEGFQSAIRSYTGFVKKISTYVFYLSAISIFLMILPVVLDVLLRLFFSRSVPGVIEIEEIFMLFLVFCGLGYAELNGDGHIRVDLLVSRFPQWVQANLNIFHTILMMVFAGLLTFYLGEIVIEKLHAGDTTADLLLPIWPFFIVAVIGLFTFVLATSVSFLNALLPLIEQKKYATTILAVVLAIAFMALPFCISGTEFSYHYSLLGGLGVLLLMLLIFLGLHIAFSMGIVGIMGMMAINPAPIMALPSLGSASVHTAMSFTFTVLPMFILMGELALYAGISKELFNTASIWLGRLPGGLAISGVAGCAGFAAICGDSMATAMTMTSVALPEMKAKNYNAGLSCAALAAGGTLGILIPPSLGFIFYAIITEESLGKLFLAGIIPGFIMAFAFCATIYFMAKRNPSLAPRGEAYSWSEKWRSLTGVLPMLGLVVLVIGGILGGIFSPTEGGAVGAAGTLVYAIVRRTISFKDFIHAMSSTAVITVRLLFILLGVNILGYFLAVTRLPFDLADMIVALETNRYVVLLLIVFLYLALGCVLNVGPMILLTLPAIFPTVTALGFDPIWFGVVTVILMEMGQITPPIGIVVFSIASMPDSAPMLAIFKYITPFVLIMLLCVLLLTIFPNIVTFLPDYLLS